MTDVFRAWPRYCEENVWHLCGELPDPASARVAFVSNAQRGVAFWCQRAATEGAPIAWDYHVILLVPGAGGEWHVLDPDSRLDMPAAAGLYLRESFRPLPPHLDRFAPRFRLVPADVYRAELRSDRSHMRAADGSWHSPPPPWPCIGSGTNLMEFVDPESDLPGEWLDLPQVRARVTPPG